MTSRSDPIRCWCWNEDNRTTAPIRTVADLGDSEGERMNAKELSDAIKLAEEKAREAFDKWRAADDAAAEAKKALAWHESGIKPRDRVEYKSGAKWIQAVAHDFCKNGRWLYVRRVLKDGSISDSTVNAYSSWRKP